MKYVISQDVHELLKAWAILNDFSLPQNGIWDDLKDGLKKRLGLIFGYENVDFVTARQLRIGINNICKAVDCQIVSLDRIYTDCHLHLEISRSVSNALSDSDDQQRFGFADIDQQISMLKIMGVKTIALLDDVVFSGTSMANLIAKLRENGITVKQVIAGIVIGEGYKKLTDMGIQVLSAYYYDRVIDEVCERDFYPGVPLSGRTIAHECRDTGAPYILPFGKPSQWASIPSESAHDFSEFCLCQTIRLWQTIGESSNRPVQCCDIGRIPIGTPDSTDDFVDFLKSFTQRE